MDIRGNTDPAAARDVTEFLAMLRDLKERRGLTYRQLEQRAAEQGEVLARSTLGGCPGRPAAATPGSPGRLRTRLRGGGAADGLAGGPRERGGTGP
ncbi:hypothetical protein [Streptomyces rimosus]|uniref:hypothetical protein n=1 Tax=Streptomyces rimosus TaxID=1927 RepID=UPI00378EAE41